VSNQRPPAITHSTPAWLRDLGKRTLREWGQLSSGLRTPPGFLLVGTKRGGTTSLYHYLLGHRDVLPMFPARRLKGTAYFTANYSHGQRWYLSHFATAPYRQLRETATRRPVITGESSPSYLFHPLAAERIAAELPSVKIIIMLRDPVARAYSHYWERVDNGVETLSFADALKAEDTRVAPDLERMQHDPLFFGEAHDSYSYRARGVYGPQLQRYLDHLPSEQVLFLSSDDFYQDQQSVFDQVAAFLKISQQTLSGRPRYNHRPAPPMDAGVQRELRDFYRPHNLDTYRIVGRDLGWPTP
jgi:Sulfotransferase domain